ncbi:MAG TPA: hypothetical protein VMV94_16955, partial [Phycisphaerae bacterium]|nr:hypothetical protein [Phycisphaerae bacterium]
MTRSIAVRRIFMALALAVIPASGACDSLLSLFSNLAGGESPAGNPLPTVPTDSVLLVLENRSGEIASVRATFENQSQQVRETIRILAASGNESSEELLRTVAERITVVATVANSSGLPSARPAPGDELARQVYELGTNYHAGDTIRFIVPPAFADCNGNHVPDDEDIAAGTSRDDNHNGIPDECESGGPAIISCAGAVVVPAGAGCTGEVPDLTGDVRFMTGNPSNVNLTIAQTPPAGAPLVPGAATSVTITVSDASGRSSSCSTTVTLRDLTPPDITLSPLTVSIGCGEPLDPSTNPSLGFASATDNCDSAPEITYSDFPPVSDSNHPCTSLIVRTWTATDSSGNFDFALQSIWVEDRSPPTIQCPPDVVIQPYESQDPQDTLSATATDDCATGQLVSFSDSTQLNLDGSRTITRTWTANDGCQASVSCTQTITVLAGSPADARVYWTVLEAGTGKIQSAFTGGTDVRTHFSAESYPREIDIDSVSGEMFWLNGSLSAGQTLRKAYINGGDVQPLPPPLANDAQGLAVAPMTQKLYWTDQVTTTQPASTVSRSDLSGSGETTIAWVPGDAVPAAIAVNELLNLVCWTQVFASEGGGRIYVCDL